MAIFNSYVKLPEGSFNEKSTIDDFSRWNLYFNGLVYGQKKSPESPMIFHGKIYGFL